MIQQHDHQHRYCVQLITLWLELLRAAPLELRYDLQLLHLLDDHRAVHEMVPNESSLLRAEKLSEQQENVLLSSLQLSCALQLRDKDDLQL
jgi:hypothetical protein